jgi:hypothetical protein
MKNKSTLNSEWRNNLEVVVLYFVVLTGHLHAGNAEKDERLALIRKGILQVRTRVRHISVTCYRDVAYVANNMNYVSV